MTENISSFPTEAKVTQKQKKLALEQGQEQVVVKKRAKKVENHYDDCGDDLSSLKGLPMEQEGYCARFVCVKIGRMQ